MDTFMYKDFDGHFFKFAPISQWYSVQCRSHTGFNLLSAVERGCPQMGN